MDKKKMSRAVSSIKNVLDVGFSISMRKKFRLCVYYFWYFFQNNWFTNNSGDRFWFVNAFSTYCSLTFSLCSAIFSKFFISDGERLYIQWYDTSEQWNVMSLAVVYEEFDENCRERRASEKAVRFEDQLLRLFYKKSLNFIICWENPIIRVFQSFF